jgi:YfiH family protein
MADCYFTPNWPAPPHIKSLSSFRNGGISTPPYDSFNLATHVNDNPAHVEHNRQQLIKQARLPEPPRWLVQTHGTNVVDSSQWHVDIDADAIFSHQTHHVCSIMTADCLPILICNQAGTFVAAIHAGWRGLADGIIKKTIQSYQGKRNELLVWLGPAIGPKHFEVGQEVVNYFKQHQFDTKEAFHPCRDNHYLADIYALARQHILESRVNNIYGGQLCTVSQSEDFFSYRRDGITGRMASMIWIDHK